ncbi:MAG: ABC transporter permease [Bacilli bacterium]|jgi:putative tryptophan/tyrosine transport system permease protein
MGWVFIDALAIGLPYALLALGIFISYRLLDFADLSAEGSFTLGGTMAVALIVLGVNPFIATLLATLCGFLAGAITGILHTKLRIPKLLSGIITMTGLFSINMMLMGWPKGASYSNVVYVGDNNTIFSYLHIFASPYLNSIITSLIIVIVVLFIIYWFFGTEIGMSIRTTGMNQNMARAQGINTTVMIILGLAISNALIAMGGAMFAQNELNADNSMGIGALVIGLSSIIIGESIFGKRTFKNWIISVALGSIMYYLIVAIAIQLGLPHYLKKLLYAVLITIVLAGPLVKRFIQKTKKKGGKVNVTD